MRGRGHCDAMLFCEGCVCTTTIGYACYRGLYGEVSPRMQPCRGGSRGSNAKSVMYG